MERTRAKLVIELVRDRHSNVAEISVRLKAPEDGALVLFEGIVRNESGGRRTLYLEYEAYEEMALRQMCLIATAMRSQFGALNAVALGFTGWGAWRSARRAFWWR